MNGSTPTKAYNGFELGRCALVWTPLHFNELSIMSSKDKDKKKEKEEKRKSEKKDKDKGKDKKDKKKDKDGKPEEEEQDVFTADFDKVLFSIALH